MKNTLALTLSLLAFAAPASFALADESTDVSIEAMDEYNARPEFGGLTEESATMDEGELALRPGHPGGPRRFRQVCMAQNRRGVVFRASGWGNRRAIQREAMQACRRNSILPGSCRALGCR